MFHRHLTDAWDPRFFSWFRSGGSCAGGWGYVVLGCVALAVCWRMWLNGLPCSDADTFKRTGFTGGINWYRNLDRNWEAMPAEPPLLKQPALYIGAEDDVVLPPTMADGLEEMVPNLEKHVIKGCGHFTQQEKPEELNALLVDWMIRRFGSETKA
ncbi:unnamed protein product [Ostreobium quekettii]|uniref:Epoxide hydrolase n=1 Tax=Ostreobium quekettii TaxID=121088 RepID=A0A8S1J9T7_9CHLO|nr:unnamed protein product [Ostreobium quekettii]